MFNLMPWALEELIKETDMEKDFLEALDDLIDSYVAATEAENRDALMEEIVSALELKLMALREEGAG